MTTARTSATLSTRVLVVSRDTRVATALEALVDALPGLAATKVVGSPCDVEDAAQSWLPHVAIVDVAARTASRDLRTVRRLARWVPVITVSDSCDLRERCAAAGSSCHCDKDGDVDALSSALATLTTDREVTR
jgi:DNA-binding NarL/FixJ family response regulator